MVFDVIILCLLTAILTAIVVGCWVYRKLQKKTSYMLDALEDNELNFKFNENVVVGRAFNKTLNRIRSILEKERKGFVKQERYFGHMLDYVKTGIVIIDGERVNYCNQRTLELLGFVNFSHVRQLAIISEELFNAFDSIDEDIEKRVCFYTESGERTLTIMATKADIHNKNVKIVALNDISDNIAENEEVSWSRLIRVLTHEIMNTITPIASLSDTLSKDIESLNVDVETMRSGLDTIATSSKGLIKFVDNYRKLTRISAPQKKPFYVRELIERVLTLAETQQNHVEYSYVEKSEDILLYADEDQISQIVINLVRNAIQADATRIEIVAQIEPSDAVRIDVINNGKPITKESQEQIFIPFFTTKVEGTGIGLSLSRQIMRLHNGLLRLSHSDEKQTIFTLIFK